MSKRAVIVHGWDGYPEEGWFPWLKAQLQVQGFEVTTPAMPQPSAPEIRSWVTTLKNEVGQVDKTTFFVGHSIGCQTILRFLEELPETVRVGGVILVAGWTKLTPQATPDVQSQVIARPWIEQPINWPKVSSHTNHFVAIFSTNDPMVPLSEQTVFQAKLGAEIVIAERKGHFSGDDGIRELPMVLDKLLQFTQ